MTNTATTQPLAFRTPEAHRAFVAEWKRRCGERFRPRRINGEDHGYILRDAIEIERAHSIAETVPGVVLCGPRPAGVVL